MNYIAKARRIGPWWAVDVEGLRGAHPQARRLDQVEAMARDVVVALTDADPGSIEIDVQPVLDPAIAAVVEQTRETRRALADLESRAQADTRAAASELVAGGLSVRDAGRLLDISHQRVAQLTAVPRRARRSGPQAE